MMTFSVLHLKVRS